MIADVVADLLTEARETDERRLLVLAGGADACLDAAATALSAVDADPEEAVLVGRHDGLGIERVAPERADSLLGTTRSVVVFDAHDGLRPNALGRVVGAVDGGGLFVLLVPPLESWPDRRDAFDGTLAVPPFSIEDVTGHFRRRFVRTLRAHPGIAIVDVDAEQIERDGLTHPPPRIEGGERLETDGRAFPAAAYEACLTRDQARALSAFEALLEPGNAVVVEADRGRGKSSAAGLAAACLAARGEDVLITAPEYRGAAEAFARADELLSALGEGVTRAGEGPRLIDVAGGGRVRFVRPPEVAPGDADVLIVDEAAALPVALLSSFLGADRVAFTTTVHGYEGAGRGFSVRFRDRVAESDLAVTDVTMSEPIRYAAGDPVEVWAFRALLLDAAPAVEGLVAEATPEAVEYRALPPEELIEDEPLLREAFGLLVLAHYRTEPDDLARLLDAPNVSVRALLHEGHVASVALLAREGELKEDLRADMYEGGRVRGNMIPDVLTGQLRDESAAEPAGVRVMRIATHASVRSRGLGSRLLGEVRAEFGPEVDWLGTGYGATPDLLSFWEDNGYSTVHLSTTRNESSGEHSAVMLSPESEAGRELHDRHAGRFAERIPGVLSDALSGADPDVVRRALRTCDAGVGVDLPPARWRLVASMAYGPGLVDVDPGPFRDLAAAHLIDPADPDLLSPRAERLLVAKVLQGRPWGEVADALSFHSRGECMRALGEAYRPLVDAYGTAPAREERDRFRE